MWKRETVGIWVENLGSQWKGEGVLLGAVWAVSIHVIHPLLTTLGSLPASPYAWLWLLSILVALPALPHHE